MPALTALLARRSIVRSCMAGSKSICFSLVGTCSSTGSKQFSRCPAPYRTAAVHHDNAEHAWRHAWPPLRGLSSNARPSVATYAAQTGSRMRPELLDDATPPLPLPDYCAGCGVKLQADDPDRPGYFKVPKKLLEPAAELGLEEEPEDEDQGAGEGVSAADEAAAAVERMATHGAASTSAPDDRSGREWLSPGAEAGLRRLDSLVDDWGLDEDGEPKLTVRDLAIAPEAEDGRARVLCARCYSLSHYGQIKSARAEAALPEFDLGRRVGRKIGLQRARRAVVLCVVDAADFDGSLPRVALQGLFSAIEGYQDGEGGSTRAADAKDVRLLLAVNKADLLPPQATPVRLERWVRTRARQGGFPQPQGVLLVSALKGQGVQELLIRLHQEVGPAGDVWVVGAQNAGKSSLINAMRRAVGYGKPKNELTTAALPGTTLGVLKVQGLMPARCSMFDTPGVRHGHQLTSRLGSEEVKLLLPKRRLKPRTFRAAEGQTVFVGGVLRMDVLRCPGATMYLTVWASDDLVCHFGKTEGADDRYEKSVGSLLTPPLGEARALGPLQPTAVAVEGRSWRDSSMDIAIAGVGWVGVGVSGTAELRVWAPEGVAITTRSAVLPDFARDLERPGFGNKSKKPAGTKQAKRK